jgi:hypothetical protein
VVLSSSKNDYYYPYFANPSGVSFLLTSSQCSTFPLTAQDTMELTSILHQQEVAIFFLTQEVPAATGYWILTSSKHKQAMGTDLSLSFFL